MTRRQVGIGGVVLLMVAIGIWAVLPKHGSSSGSVAHETVTEIPVHAAQIPGSLAVAKPAAVSSLWARPAAKVAARNSRRFGFAWILRQLGATENQLDGLANLDITGVLSELKQKAAGGDPASINILGEIALQNCRSGRDDATLESFTASQIRDVQAVPVIDAAWFSDVMQEEEGFYKDLHAACAQVDVDQAMSWVTARANQGDGASLWLMFIDSNNMREMQQRLRDAAAAGFPQAQFELAWAILGGQEGAAGSGTAKVSAGEMLKASSEKLPRSEMQLAVCEYSGCDGVAVDMDAAIKHAREAARRGDQDAIVYLGPHIPAGLLDPDEVTAWGLVQASLQQRGCGGGFSVREMKSISSTLNANNLSAQARALAERYWKDYSAQMMKNIGCTP